MPYIDRTKYKWLTTLGRRITLYEVCWKSTHQEHAKVLGEKNSCWHRFKDFEQLCRERNIKVLNRLVVDQTHQSSWLSGLWPNMLGEVAIYRVSR